MQIVTSWAEQAERSLIFRLLTWRVGEISDATKAKIDNLPITQLEDLGETLLDFRN